MVLITDQDHAEIDKARSAYEVQCREVQKERAKGETVDSILPPTRPVQFENVTSIPEDIRDAVAIELIKTKSGRQLLEDLHTSAVAAAYNLDMDTVAKGTHMVPSDWL